MKNLRYSVHAYAWTGSWSNKTLHIIDKVKGLGFDMIEIPLMEIELVDPGAIKNRLEDVGIGVLTSTACQIKYDPTAEDENTRRGAVEYLKKCVKATADMGAGCFSGVIYSAMGRRIEQMPGEEYWERAVKAVKEVARYAQDFGIEVGIEPINRYETFLINTADQALRLIKMIDEPNVKIHLDSYHMNIEEENFYEPTKKVVRHLCQYHLSESHRGTVGEGTVNWEEIYRALSEGEYNGTVGMEGFIEIAPSMAAATCIWRKLAENIDESLTKGLSYLKGLEKKYYTD
jgi:D-psicose/D-tagatose/L-ribulose 3-epimerase